MRTRDYPCQPGPTTNYCSGNPFPNYGTGGAGPRLPPNRLPLHTPCIYLFFSAALCPAGLPILIHILTTTLCSPLPSAVLCLSGQLEGQRSSENSRRSIGGGRLQQKARRSPRVAVRRLRGWAACIDSPPERKQYVRMCPLVSGDCMSHGERAYLHGQRRKGRERREGGL